MSNTREIMARLRSRKRSIKRITLPGTEEVLGLVALTQDEVLASQLATQEALGDKANDLAMMDAWNAECAVQMMSRAIVHPEHIDGDVLTVFKSADELRKSLTTEEIAWVENEYHSHPDKSFWRTLDSAKIEAAIKEVATDPTTGQSGSK